MQEQLTDFRIKEDKLNADLLRLQNSKQGIKDTKQKREVLETDLKDLKRKIGDLKINLRKLDAIQ